MDWTNERYVRVYTRDTPEWIMLSWQARALFHEIMRKVDRAGVLSLGRAGVRGLAALVRMPPEVVDEALGELITDGCVESPTVDVVVIPNFIDAQESRQSDAHRSRESRARRRDAARGGSPSSPVADESSCVDSTEESSTSTRFVSQSSHDVTQGHEQSRSVTPSCAVPSQIITPHSARPVVDEVVVAPGLPLPTPLLADFEALAMTTGSTLDAVEEWAKFVDHCLGLDVPKRSFASSEQLSAWWRKWIRRGAQFEKRDRVREASRGAQAPRGRGPAKQPPVDTSGWSKPIVADPETIRRQREEGVTFDPSSIGDNGEVLS